MNLFKSLFGGGIQHVEPLEALARLQTKPAPLLLDVRQPEEYRAAHIANAKLLPLNELARRQKELPKEREILCICASGSRSQAAVRQLSGLGYNAVNIRGGMHGWQRAGLPVQKGAR
jgi:rhodanese-related sulfurtransferase